MLHGKPALRSYWERALAAFPELDFVPIATLVGIGSVALHYVSVNGLLACEVLSFDADGRVVSASAHYTVPPQSS